jgi:hypothetical protein
MEFSQQALQASRIMGTPLDACASYASYMIEAGFKDVVETRMKLPSGPWPKGTRLKLIGAFEMDNLLRGLSGMSYRMFSKAFGWTPQQTEVFLVNVRKDLQNMRYHTYWDLCVSLFCFCCQNFVHSVSETRANIYFNLVVSLFTDGNQADQPNLWQMNHLCKYKSN